MRKIEKQMLDAIHDGRNWKSGNTQVVCTQFAHGEDVIDRVTVILHGSPIAIITPDHVDASDCGYQTPTTKSRLNVVLHEFCDAGIFQVARKWYARRDGEENRSIAPRSRQIFNRKS
jgi:hypothetical protein